MDDRLVSRAPGAPLGVEEYMEDAHLVTLINDQGEREPLLSRSEARVVVELLLRPGEPGGQRAAIRAELAADLARRLPSE